MKYGSHVPQVPEPRNTSFWKAFRQHSWKHSSVVSQHSETRNFSFCRFCPNASSHWRQNFRHSMISTVFPAQHLGLQWKLQAASLPAETEVCILQWNCLAWSLKHSLVGAGWSGLTDIIPTLQSLFGLTVRGLVQFFSPGDCGLWFKSSVQKAALVHGFMQVVYSSTHELLHTVLSKEKPTSDGSHLSSLPKQWQEAYLWRCEQHTLLKIGTQL